MERFLPVAIIVDVDGTLAKMSDRSPYDWQRVKEDTVHNHVRKMVNLLKTDGLQVIVLSGRDGSCEQLTREWLLENDIAFDYLFMRPAGNFEQDVVIKERIYREQIENQFRIFAVFDDRLQVCKLWYKLGLPLYRVGDPEANF